MAETFNDAVDACERSPAPHFASGSPGALDPFAGPGRVVDARRPVSLGRCACGAEVMDVSFRDRGSYLHSLKHPFCQECQDAVYLARDPGTGESRPLRTALFAVAIGTASGGLDFAAIPVRYTVPRAPLAVETRRVVRVARSPTPEPWRDLLPLGDCIRDHALSVCSAEVWCDGVAERVGMPDVLITLDWSMAALAVRVAPVLRRVHRLLISEVHDLGDILGIVPACLIDDVVHRQFEDMCCGPSGGPATALELCARSLGPFLDRARWEPSAEHTALDVLLERHGPRLVPGSAHEGR